MLAAFARAARILPSDDKRARYLDAAERAARFLDLHMWDEERQVLKRRYREGDAGIDGYAEDYACLIFGLLELFQAGGSPHWLEWARALQRRLDEQFWDDEHGGWFNTTGGDPSVILRMKEDYDGAEPSPTSVAAINLLTLSHLTGDTAYRARAHRAIASFGPRLAEQGRAVPMMAAALSMALQPGEQIVVVGAPDDPSTAAMRRAVERRHRPFAVVMPVAPGERQARIAAMVPFVAGMKAIDGRAAAYVCRDFACDAPVTDPVMLR
jgi:uncharacterized protein YyaL (SSP411 family)